MRNPLKNPQAGDALALKATGSKIQVLLRDGDDVDYLMKGKEFSCTIANWRAFVSNCEVLHVAESTAPDRGAV